MNTRSNRKVKIVNYGIANIIGDVIHVNRRLLRYPKLYQKVMDHEQAHLNGDDTIDIKERMGWRMTYFIIKHPSSWCQFIPLWYIDDTLIYNKSMALLWILGLIITLFIFIAYHNPKISLILAALLPFIASVLTWLVFHGENKKKTRKNNN